MSFYENIHNGNFEEAIKLLIEKGADLNAIDKYGYTALIWACRNNNIEIVKLLIEKGADINAKNFIGYTALIWACRNNNTEVIKLLIEKELILMIKMMMEIRL